MEQTDVQLAAELGLVPEKHENRVIYKNRLMTFLANLIDSKQTKLKGTASQYTRGDGSYVSIPPVLSHSSIGTNGPSTYNTNTGALIIPDYSVKQPRMLASFYNNVTLPASVITEFYPYTVLTNTFKNNGDYMEIDYIVEYTTITNQSPFLSLSFGSNNLLSKNVTGNGTYQHSIKSSIVRVNNTTLRHYTYLNSPDGRTGYVEVVGLNLLGSEYIIKGTLNATSAVSGTARMGTIKFFPAP